MVWHNPQRTFKTMKRKIEYLSLWRHLPQKYKKNTKYKNECVPKVKWWAVKLNAKMYIHLDIMPLEAKKNNKLHTMNWIKRKRQI